MLNYCGFQRVSVVNGHVSGMTLCWPFNSHYGELSHVFMFLFLLMWIDEMDKTHKQ